MYACIYVCMHEEWMYVCLRHVCMHVCVCVCMCMYVCLYVWMCINEWRNVCMYLCMHAWRMNVCLPTACMNACMYACMYVCAYLYVHIICYVCGHHLKRTYGKYVIWVLLFFLNFLFDFKKRTDLPTHRPTYTWPFYLSFVGGRSGSGSKPKCLTGRGCNMHTYMP